MKKTVTFGEIMLRLKTPEHLRIVQTDGFEASYGGAEANVAVSLAVQDSLAKLAGGLMVLAAKPFVVGDFIDAGSVSGTVQEIGLIYTCLSTPDNKKISC